MVLTVTLNAAIDKRYVVDRFQTGAVNRVAACTFTPGGKRVKCLKDCGDIGGIGGCNGICRRLCRKLY